MIRGRDERAVRPTATHRTESAGALAPRQERDRIIRVAIAARVPRGRIAGDGAWRLIDQDGHGVPVVRAAAGKGVTLEARSGQLRAVREDGFPPQAFGGTLVARPTSPDGVLSWEGKRYRGELAFLATTSGGFTVVNRVPIEDYLRGVVPRELGERPREERAAAEAQAVAARSYAYVRATNDPARDWDVEATVAHQVYGGADAERPVSDEAIARTAGLVLLYAGRVVDAPYHSTCGGSTAEAPEVWRTTGEPFLRRVSDRIPGTDRYYCDGATRFAWTQSFTGAQLEGLLARYLGQYATGAPAGGPGRVRGLSIDGRTPSGRAAAVALRTERGTFVVRGNDMRFVLRAANGEILNSTYVSVEQAVVGRDGYLSQLVLRGNGYGHGIGMCQWGAIGRARAGQDFRTILRTYYPGVGIGTVE